MILETERLRLRPLARTDAVAYFELRADPAVTRYLLRGPFADVGEARARLDELCAQIDAGTLHLWAIERDGRLIGSAGLPRWDRTHRNASVSYELRRDAWGQGFGREVVARVVSFGFEHVGLHRIQAEIHPEHRASIRLVEALGFAYEGTLREDVILPDGTFGDSAIYARLSR